MWGARTLERARRRLVRAPEPSPEPRPEQASPDGHGGNPSDDTAVSVALTRRDKDRFAAALSAQLGDATPRLDTPARVASALIVALDRVGGRGRPHVVRKPAGLYTPEYWHISIHGADHAARAELERLAAVRRTEP